MKQPSNTIFYLCLLIALLAGVYAGVGLFSRGGPGPSSFTTLRGQTLQLYGQGIYRNDSAFRAPIFRGTDAVTLFLCLPALLAAATWYRRGALRAGLLLAGILAFFLYNSASLAFSAMYNELLLVYIACASASLFAFIGLFQSIDLPGLAAHSLPTLPHRRAAAFLFLASAALFIWIADIVSGLVSGSAPAALGPYTTEATYILDIAVLLPSVLMAAVQIWRRRPLGTLLGCVLIVLNLSVGLVVIGQTVMQAFEGIVLRPAEFAAYVAPFVTLSLMAIALILTILRNIREPGVVG